MGLGLTVMGFVAVSLIIVASNLVIGLVLAVVVGSVFFGTLAGGRSSIFPFDGRNESGTGEL